MSIGVLTTGICFIRGTRVILRVAGCRADCEHQNHRHKQQMNASLGTAVGLQLRLLVPTCSETLMEQKRRGRQRYGTNGSLVLQARTPRRQVAARFRSMNLYWRYRIIISQSTLVLTARHNN